MAVVIRMGDQLTIWVIYFGATNHPAGKWVVRAHDVIRPEDGKLAEIRPRQGYLACDSLEEARAKVPPGRVRMLPGRNDDPVIVESWV